AGTVASQGRRDTLLVLCNLESAVLQLALGRPAAGWRAVELIPGTARLPVGIASRLAGIRAQLLFAEGARSDARAFVTPVAADDTAEMRTAVMQQLVGDG